MPRNQKPRRSLAAAMEPPEPYPDLPFPTAEQCRSVRDDLLSFQGFPKEFERYHRPATIAAKPPLSSDESVIDGLVSILLSQNTTEANSRRAFASLKCAFPTWEEVLSAETRSVEKAIRCGGLATTKAARIKNIMRGLMERRGQICLEYLRGLSVAEVKTELSQFKGIGPKTVACVLMFHLQQEDFPVDTHVFRITKAIGWVPMKADREKAYLHLNKRIPNDLKFDLNCLLVSHGKICHRCANKGGDQPTTGSNASCPLTTYAVM
ncbi:putative DNA glycosylase At3g47830 [Dendrobium catenatum]|uniref:Protein ROS1 n=1 Tax=Dendrobium catenatum TaxID=906689 RepID=A0A2I0W2B6_9ASPA|nr:putative DNA glycosylase At3g47830 [Dendrobium catenatum]PKU69768.1 Protein ROS1 [Dendrobium catenatum]